jgi:hypothetical protein
VVSYGEDTFTLRAKLTARPAPDRPDCFAWLAGAGALAVRRLQKAARADGRAEGVKRSLR